MKAKAIEQPGQRKYDWVLIDKDTGKLLDDNQGLGYKTGVSAHELPLITDGWSPTY